MGLIRDLKDNQINSITEEESLEKEWKNRVIPESKALQIAENIYNRVLKNAKRITTNKDNVKFDTNLFGLKRNYHYEAGLDYLNASLCINTQRKDLWLDRDWEDVFPKNNGFFGCMEHDSSPTEILCGNINNLKRVFSIVVEKFKKEKVDAVFKIEDIQMDRPIMIFYIIIPCDKNGTITE